MLRFKDCPLCGAGIQGIEPDSELQALVDRLGGKSKVIYEDVSMERGAFLVQQAMRVSGEMNCILPHHLIF